MSYPENRLWSIQHDEHGNYLVDPNGNQVACIYEMAVVGALLNVLNGPTTAMVEAGEYEAYSPEETARIFKAMIKAAFE